MRTLLMLCLIALITGNSFAQNTYSEIGTKTEYITEVKGSKDYLFLNAQQWASTNTTEWDSSIDTSDKESGTTILKVSSYLSKKNGVNSYSKIRVNMNVKIDCRENRYRIIFSNFTSSVQPDRNVETEYLSTSSLENMIEELEMIAKLSEYDFKKETSWGYDNIIRVREKYISQNKEYKEKILTFDSNSKKGKKEIKYREKWIKENEIIISYLDYILKGFGDKVTEINSSINKVMNVSDDF